MGERKFVDVPEPLVPGWYLAKWENPLETVCGIVKMVPQWGGSRCVRKVGSDLYYHKLADFTFLAKIEAPELEP